MCVSQAYPSQKVWVRLEGFSCTHCKSFGYGMGTVLGTA
nr:MAG TPA: hypothetical protein [Caudoviricetes sp.]